MFRKKDMSNAFASMRRDVLERIDATHRRDCDKRLFADRRASIFVSMDASDGIVHAVPQAGGMMGDSNAAKDFRAGFDPRVSVWQQRYAIERCCVQRAGCCSLFLC